MEDDLRRVIDALAGDLHAGEVFRLIAESIAAPIAVLHADWGVEALNRPALDYFGMTLAQLKDWPIAGVVHPHDLPAVMEAATQSATLGEPYDIEHRCRRADGAWRWFHVRAVPLRDREGGILRWYVLLTDIHDRKLAEDALRASHYHLTEGQRLSRTGSFTSDPVADEHTWSDELYRICDFEPGSEVTIRRLRDIVHSGDVALYDAEIDRGLAGHDFDFMFRIVTRTGALKHLRGVGRVVQQTAGRPAFVGAIQDVTESKLAEDALNRARAELAHVSRIVTLGTLTAAIAHEVNNPLSGIVTNAGACLRMLATDPPDIEGARDTARRTIRDGCRAAEVVSRLRALFANKGSVTEPLDLNEATRDVIALSRSELQRGGVILRLELREGLPLVAGDRVQLQQVVLNLLLNAAEAMNEVRDRPRQLLIRTEREGDDRLRMTVEDAGVGLEPHDIDKLFQSFYTTKKGGMGIGLSVSRSIVERHGGRMWATPKRDGPGACFCFSIPITCADAVPVTG